MGLKLAYKILIAVGTLSLVGPAVILSSSSISAAALPSNPCGSANIAGVTVDSVTHAPMFYKCPATSSQPASIVFGTTLSGGSAISTSQIDKVDNELSPSGITGAVETDSVYQDWGYGPAAACAPPTSGPYAGISGGQPCPVNDFNQWVLPDVQSITSANTTANGNKPVPVISWQPQLAGAASVNQPAYTDAALAADIENGEHNPSLNSPAQESLYNSLVTWGQEAAAYGGPVFVRFAAEANVGNNGNPWDYNANSYAPSQACATCYGDGMTFNASFSAGRNQLTVVNSSSPSVGDNILDVTTPSNLPAGATVGAVSGTSVTLANGATATGSTGNDQLAVIHHGNTSADYVRMWNDVKDLITSYAKNITFIWNPAVDYFNDFLPAGGNQTYATFQSMFPTENGTPNVSVMALDGYSWGQRSCGSVCAISTTVFTSSVADLSRLSGDPIWIAETATAEPTSQELASGAPSKAAWIESLWQQIADPTSPGFNQVVGFGYFNYPGCSEFEFDGPGVNDPCPNWSDPQALTMLQGLIHEAYAHGGPPATDSEPVVVPQPTLRYFPLTPYRVLDTRTGQGAPQAPLGSGATLNVQVSGVHGPTPTQVVPAGAAAVVMNVTVDEPTAASFLTVWPQGAPQPTTSNLNFVAGDIRPNLAQVALGSSGQVSIFNHFGTTQVVADVQGYFAPAPATPAKGLFNPLTPARLLDTRTTTGGHPTPLGPGGTLDLQVTGQGGVPASGVAAVVLNVTVTNPTCPGFGQASCSFLSVWPTGAPRPLSSNVNFGADGTVANRVIVPVGAGGRVSIFNNFGGADVVADVGGWFTDGADAAATGDFYTPINPTRILDTRNTTPVGSAQAINLPVAGVAGIPAAATAAVANVTVADTTEPSFLTVYPAGESRPVASDINWVPGQITQNLVQTGLGSGGAWSIFNWFGRAAVIADVGGYYLPVP